MRIPIALLALAMLAGCGSKEAKAPQGASFGQVLPGSVSDAMPPYDTVTSSPPLAPETYDASEDGNGQERSSAVLPEADDAAPEVEAT